MMRLCIVGFGLIGGSIAAALRARGHAVHLTAIDGRAVLETPRAAELADALVDAGDDPGRRSALSSADLVVLAVPVRRIEVLLPEALELARAVTDCGSTKRALMRAAAALPRGRRFVGGHPMAGAPQGGVHNARADLFEGRGWILCPEASDAECVEKVRGLLQAVGAREICMSAEQHDRAVAVTSHVPQLLASALCVQASAAKATVAAGPAYAGATRVAGGPADMWRDIFATNGDEVARALGELCGELQGVAGALAGGDPERALGLLERARRERAGERE